VQIVLVDVVGRGQRHAYFFRGDGRILCVPYFREQDHELIAPLPADSVRVAHRGDQPLGHGLQQVVADGVTQ
jgi:hypothetical protein